MENTNNNESKFHEIKYMRLLLIKALKIKKHVLGAAIELTMCWIVSKCYRVYYYICIINNILCQLVVGSQLKVIRSGVLMSLSAEVTH